MRPSHVKRKTTNYSRKFGFMHQDTSWSTIRRRGGKIIFNGQGSLVTGTCYNCLEFWTQCAVVRLLACFLPSTPLWGANSYSFRCPSRSSFWRHSRCIVGKTWLFPALKINTIQIAISVAVDVSYVWKENRIYGLFSKSGIGVIRLELYLLIMPR